MDPNGYTDQIANAIFAVFASGRWGNALDSIQTIGSSIESIGDAADILCSQDKIIVDTEIDSSIDELSKAAWEMASAFDSIARAINNHAETMGEIADAIDQLANAVGKE